MLSINVQHEMLSMNDDQLRLGIDNCISRLGVVNSQPLTRERRLSQSRGKPAYSGAECRMVSLNRPLESRVYTDVQMDPFVANVCQR